ncbi:hypothetical protein NIES4074_44230 [Cylindrospermum sp. NIES-4074]|nr:hypothetical protein NIES4074_44230 [Cylindrospermum sp. NIES-4074]
MKLIFLRRITKWLWFLIFAALVPSFLAFSLLAAPVNNLGKNLNSMNSGLKLEIATTKPTYRIGEDVIIRVFLFNFGNDSVIVNSRLALNGAGFPGELSFDVLESSGNSIPFNARVNVGKPNAADFSTLAPSHFHGKQIKLQPYFSMEKIGQFKLKATYTNKWTGEEMGLKVWTGNLESNTILFQVEN